MKHHGPAPTTSGSVEKENDANVARYYARALANDGSSLKTISLFFFSLFFFFFFFSRPLRRPLQLRLHREEVV